MRFLFPLLIIAGGAGYGAYRLGGNPFKSDVFSWLTEIPKREWLERGFPILGGYLVVFVAVSYLNFVFTLNETYLLGFIRHPLTAFFFSVFITVLLQASFITEFAVIFAAAGLVNFPVTIALILGGNIGTCITNTVVSFLSFSQKEQFSKAFSASIVHDLFNIFMVLLVFPLELATGFFSGHMLYLADIMGSNVRAPVQNFLPQVFIMQNVGGFIPGGQNLTYGIMGLIAVAAALGGVLVIVVNLKALFFDRIADVLKKDIFTSKTKSVGAGVGFTFLVHSSSLSTSMIVPLVAEGSVTLPRAFHYMLGCNVGTAIVTVTTTLPIILSGSLYGTGAAFGHLMFNVYGMLLFLAVPVLGTTVCAAAEAISGHVKDWSSLKLGGTLAGIYYAAPAVAFLVCLAVFR